MRTLQLAAVCLFIGAGFLVMGSVTKSWASLDIEDVSIRVGLRELDACGVKSKGDCETQSLDGESKHDAREVVMVWSGKFAFGMGLATAIASVICGILFLSQGRNTGAFVALCLGSAAFIAAMVFELSFPDLGKLEFSRGLSGLSYLIGAGLCVVASGAALSRWGSSRSESSQQQMPAIAVMGHAVPACPKCSAPTAYNNNHRRYFCEGCRLYI